MDVHPPRKGAIGYASWPFESQSKPGVKMVDPQPCKESRRRISAAIYGWDWPLLTFINPRVLIVSDQSFAHLVLLDQFGHGKKQ